MKKLLKELCMLDGVSGYEEDVCAYIKNRVAPYAESITVDALGNLIVFKKGENRRAAPLMVCAHMDEVGFLVYGFTDDGMLRISTVGGIDPRVLIGRRMKVGPKKIPGVISLKAIHLTTAEERKIAPDIDHLYVDTGASSREEIEKVVSIGDPVTFDSRFIEFGDKCVKAKAIDDRVGCAVMIKIIEQPIEYDTYFVFSTNEEIGGRGALVAAKRIKPAYCMALEGTTACDMPGIEGHMRSTMQRCGAAISFIDGGTVYDRRLVDAMTAAADRDGIKWQFRKSSNGSTDNGVMHKANAGCKAFGVSVPTRYIHSACNVAYLPDIDEVYKLAKLFIKETGEKNV